jgi:hypothetical protein
MDMKIRTAKLDSHIGNDSVFSGKYRDAMFSDSMIAYPNNGDHSAVDQIQTYEVNSSGYRGPDFQNDVDFLFAGCSFTYGMGVPENGIWGSLIAKEFGWTYNNLSKNGASVPWIVRQLFAYFKEYGNPKTLVCLFPTLTRTFFASNSEILISDNGYVEDSTKDLESKKSIYNIELGNVRRPSMRPDYSKKPHSLEDVVNIDSVVQIAMQNIRILEQYCRSSGINFVWGTWSEAFSSLMEGPGGLLESYSFDHYVGLDVGRWGSRNVNGLPDRFFNSVEDKRFCKEHHRKVDCDCPLQCHSEMSSEYGESFYLGTDNRYGKQPHFGVHRHIHIAESFIKRLLTTKD